MFVTLSKINKFYLKFTMLYVYNFIQNSIELIDRIEKIKYIKDTKNINFWQYNAKKVINSYKD